MSDTINITITPYNQIPIELNMTKGLPGDNGKSTYELYLDTDPYPILTLEEWLSSQGSGSPTISINSYDAKETPVDADITLIEDSAATFAKKKLSWANIKATLKSYFDTLYPAKNTSITGATKTKISYDAKGLVTSGSDATTADIADSTNKRYCTDAQKTVIGNTSGTNSGDNATNSQYSGLVSNATHTGAVTGSTELSITDKAVTLAKMADMATGSLIYRKTAATGVPEVQTLTTLKTDLGIDDLSGIATVAAVTNTYTLDLANAFIKNFKITSVDANAKTITLSNVPNTADKIITISVLLICTTAAAFTHPTGTTFAAGTPTFTTGQSYWITYESIDGGTSWAGYSIRRT